jgi:CRISPR-associated protein Csm2
MEVKEIEEMDSQIKGFKPIEEAKKLIDLNRPLNEELLKFSKKFGFFLCCYELNSKTNKWEMSKKNALTNSQIRNFFGEIKRIQMTLFNSESDEDWKNVKHSFLLIKPKLAYAVGRVTQKESKSRIAEFGKVLSLAIEKVDSDNSGATKRFYRFVDFFESILAYHKAYGGKD